MKRLIVMDGFRGFFLIFMAVTHFNGVIHSVLGTINHHALGWVEDAQGFVFVSGFFVGLVYGRSYLRDPTPANAFRPVYARARTIYLHQAGLVLFLVAAALVLGSAVPGELRVYEETPVTFTLTSLLLLSSSSNMGILPMYIYFMLVTPLALITLRRGLVAPYVLVIVLLWLVAQSGMAGILMYRLQVTLVEAGIPARFGLYFSLIGWQVLFFGGLYCGFRMAQGRLDLGFLRSPQFRPAFFIALAGVGTLAVLDLLIANGLLDGDLLRRFHERNSRNSLSPIYVVNFGLDLFVVVWLLVVGVEDRLGWVRGLSRGIRWFFTRPFLVFLGQHSLHVFSFHILVCYLLATVMQWVDPSAPMRAMILVISVASVYLGAIGHVWLQGRPLRGAVIGVS